MRSKQEEADKIEIQVDKLRKKYEAVKSEESVISEDSFICKTCKRAFDPENIQAMRVHMLEDFYREKAETLNGINVEGKPQKERWLHLKEELATLGPELEEYNSKLSELTDQRLKLNAGIENFTPHINLLENEEYMKISKEAEELEAGLSEPAESTGEELKEAKRELSIQMDECRKKLLIREQNEKFRGRIAELMEQKSVLDKQIGSLEAREILCDEFVKTKAKLLESRINSKFKFVTFKLINTLKNGAVEEEWEALIDGVPFSSANKAGQINAGLDIINTLCEYYRVSAPIFIDNRESINRILGCKSQIINLIVSRDKGLKVVNSGDMSLGAPGLPDKLSESEASGTDEKKRDLAAGKGNLSGLIAASSGIGLEF